MSLGGLGEVRRAWQMLRYLGPGWLAFRLGYAVRGRSGALVRRSPVRPWLDFSLDQVVDDPRLSAPARYHDYRLHSAPRFLFSPADRAAYGPLLMAMDGEGVGPEVEVERLRAGEVQFFGHDWRHVGIPPAWHRPGAAGRGDHWSRVSDFAAGDIKEVWEPSRFGFVYALVRSYWRTGEPGCAETFWQLVEDWLDANPPNAGANWKCGQEATFRLMAWCVGLHGFLDAPATTAGRVATLAGMVAATALRIEANVDYALSQQNNHGVSEGAGLLTAGLLFPELRGSARWQRRGRRILTDLAYTLVYDDGSFAQHSLNYHRVMLDVYTWAIRIADLAGSPLPQRTRDRVAAAGRFLAALVDPRTGIAPCYGHNDGAQVLPLSSSGYGDYRPTAAAASYLAGGQRIYGPGPHDEQLLWLFGPASLNSPAAAVEPGDFAAPDGGCWVLAGGAGRAMLRSQSFRHRPAHADQLHMDLAWRGQPIAVDGGTYSYNAPDPWCNPFAGAAAHNTVTVDARDQMELASRFLWLPWSRGEVAEVQRSEQGHVAAWQSSHDGYLRLPDPVAHRRIVVQLAGEWWLVLDLLSAKMEHTYRLHWLLADLPYEQREADGSLSLATPAGSYRLQVGVAGGGGERSVVRADDSSPRGWRSSYYAAREPALSVAVEARRDRGLFWSLFGPGDGVVEVRGLVAALSGTGIEAQVRLGEGADGFELDEVCLCAPVEDYLKRAMPTRGSR